MIWLGMGLYIYNPGDPLTQILNCTPSTPKFLLNCLTHSHPFTIIHLTHTTGCSMSTPLNPTTVAPWFTPIYIYSHTHTCLFLPGLSREVDLKQVFLHTPSWHRQLITIVNQNRLFRINVSCDITTGF